MSNTYIALVNYLTTFEGKDDFQYIYNLNIFSEDSLDKNEDAENANDASAPKEQIVPEQLTPICINKELNIYCTIYFNQCEGEGMMGNKKESVSNTIIYTIRIELFSYTSSVFKIKEFVDKITDEYVDTILQEMIVGFVDYVSLFHNVV